MQIFRGKHNTVSLIEQSWCMALELYCRKAERKREGRRREASHGHMERGGGSGGGRRAIDENKRGESLIERGGVKQLLF